MSGWAWRPMTGEDIDGVVMTARVCFPDHFEARACFEERLALFPQGCFVLACGDAVKGYCIAYPWPEGSVPPLDSLLGALPQGRAAFYLHDLALQPEVRGQGHARPIVERLALDLRGIDAKRIALVSVNDSVRFWQGQGFAPVAPDETMARKLASYGAGAQYMVREV